MSNHPKLDLVGLTKNRDFEGLVKIIEDRKILYEHDALSAEEITEDMAKLLPAMEILKEAENRINARYVLWTKSSKEKREDDLNEIKKYAVELHKFFKSMLFFREIEWAKKKGEELTEGQRQATSFFTSFTGLPLNLYSK